MKIKATSSVVQDLEEKKIESNPSFFYALTMLPYTQEAAQELF